MGNSQFEGVFSLVVKTVVYLVYVCEGIQEIIDHHPDSSTSSEYFNIFKVFLGMLENLFIHYLATVMHWILYVLVVEENNNLSLLLFFYLSIA